MINQSATSSQTTNPSRANATGKSDSTAHLDCVIVGAGPAGLTALEYLARFHRQAVALGVGGPKPRLLAIDRTYNLPGYPAGVRGEELLLRLKIQAEAMGGVLRQETAEKIEGQDGNFTVHLSDGSKLQTRKVILAMGVKDRQPDIPNLEPHIGHFLRYCPVCDGYEHTGKHLGIIGSGPSVARHALFLQTFSNHISIFLHGANPETLGHYAPMLAEKGIEVFQPRIEKILERSDLEADETSPDTDTHYYGCGVCLADGSAHTLSVLYGALGCDLHLEPIQDMQMDVDEDGYVKVDINQETSVKGIYAAGDIVSQINQISVAFGQAAIAAVRIHNALDDEETNY